MRRLRLPLLALLLLCAGCSGAPRPAAPPADPSLRVMSFNLRLNTSSDGPNAWPHRREAVAGLIRSNGADLLGVQEALRGMLDDLAAALPEYGWFGVGRADGQDGGEFSAIFYRKDRFDLLSHDTFWLSPTPEVPGSKGWDAAIERIVTWGRLRDRRTGRAFYHFNTHFDHVGETARAESARLIRGRILQIADGAPVILTGDFNVTPSAQPYALLTTAVPERSARLHDALIASAAPHEGPRSTWNGFKEIEPDRRIDFIFVTDAVRVLSHRILPDQLPDGRFPSDHLPVLAVVEVK